MMDKTQFVDFGVVLSSSVDISVADMFGKENGDITK